MRQVDIHQSGPVLEPETELSALRITGTPSGSGTKVTKNDHGFGFGYYHK